MRFHLMRQSELKVRANKQFLLVDNDAKRIRGRFLNHSTVSQQLLINFILPLTCKYY